MSSIPPQIDIEGDSSSERVIDSILPQQTSENLRYIANGNILASTSIHVPKSYYIPDMSQYVPSLTSRLQMRDRLISKLESRMESQIGPSACTSSGTIEPTASNSIVRTSHTSWRGRTLVKQDRCRITPSHHAYFYNKYVSSSGNFQVSPSSTGYDPRLDFNPVNEEGFEPVAITSSEPQRSTAVYPDGCPVSNDNRGHNFSTGLTYSATSHGVPAPSYDCRPDEHNRCNYSNSRSKCQLSADSWFSHHDNRLPSMWTVYCQLITLPAVPIFLKWCGIKGRKQQEAWREKIGLNFIILFLTALVGFLTFGLSGVACFFPSPRVHYENITSDTLVIHGMLFNISAFTHQHEAITYVYPQDQTLTRIIGGTDGSLLFQNVNNYCKDFIAPKKSSLVPRDRHGLVSWYYHCNALSMDGRLIENPDIYNLYSFPIYNHSSVPLSLSPTAQKLHALHELKSLGYGCHLSNISRSSFYSMPKIADVYYTWQDVENPQKKLIVYNGVVIDLQRLMLLTKNWTLRPPLNRIIRVDRRTYRADMSQYLSATLHNKNAARCLVEVAKVGVLDTASVGCISSTIVLYLSLSFIFSIVIIKFLFALYFEWFLSWKMGNVADESWNRKVLRKGENHEK